MAVVIKMGMRPEEFKMIYDGVEVENIRSCDIRVRPDEVVTATIELYPAMVVIEDCNINIKCEGKKYRVLEVVESKKMTGV